MNVSEQIINVLDNLCQKFGIAIDWSAQNVLPYIKELMARFINWEIAVSIIWIVLGVVMIIIGTTSTRYIWKRKDKYDYFGDPDEGITWGFIVSIALVVIGVLVSLVQCFDIVEAIYLPEKTIYDFINYQIDLHN